MTLGDLGTWVGVGASLLVSGIALFFSRRSAQAAEQSAQAAQQSAQADQQIAREAAKPQLRADVVKINLRYRLDLRLEGPRDLDSVRVEITEGEGIGFTEGQYGVDQREPRPRRRAHSHEPLRVGGLAGWGVEISRDTPPVIWLRVECHAGDDEWTVGVEAKVPRRPGRVIV